MPVHQSPRHIPPGIWKNQRRRRRASKPECYEQDDRIPRVDKHGRLQRHCYPRRRECMSTLLIPSGSGSTRRCQDCGARTRPNAPLARTHADKRARLFKDGRLNTREATTEATATGSRVNNNRQCDFCAQTSHSTRDCGFKKSVECWRCQERGLKAKHCHHFLDY